MISTRHFPTSHSTTGRAARARRVAVAVAVLCGASLAPTTPTLAVSPVRLADDEQIAPGVVYRSFTWDTEHGSTKGYVLEADLAEANLELLHGASVADPTVVSELADARGAVAGVNGDFFNASEEHEGVDPTGSAVGPEIAAEKDRKASVPDGQRFGPSLPEGTTNEDVFGVGVDGTARVASLALEGKVETNQGVLELDGLNQYALPENGVGVYTPEWAATPRVRPTCGSDTDRGAPCSDTTIEVIVKDGKVSYVHEEPGDGRIEPGTFVLIGREDGVAELDGLKVGDPVSVDFQLVPSNVPQFRFAVGGFPILRDGTPLSDLDNGELAPRTSAGASADGKRVYLVAMDGRSDVSVGLSIRELAHLLGELGADDAVNLDGGGSTTLVAREEGQQQVTVRNNPSDGQERPVANGIGIFSGE